MDAARAKSITVTSVVYARLGFCMGSEAGTSLMSALATIVQPYYGERVRKAWKWLKPKVPVHGLDLNGPEVNERLVCHFGLIDLFRFYAELVKQNRIYFTAGKVARVHLVTAQQRERQRKKKGSSDYLFARGRWPLLPGSYEMGKDR